MANEIDLPTHADPNRLAKRQVRLAGRLDLHKLTRLTPLLLASAESCCQVVLAFSLNERGVSLIQGRVTGCLQLVCQRCLGAFAWDFNLPINLAVIKSETEEAKIPSGFEALFSLEEAVNLNEAVEDELLLNVPNYPVHENNCKND